jgi:long-chain acyl-CoA synthetase
MPAPPPVRHFDLTRHTCLGSALAEASFSYRSNPFLCLSDRGRVVETLSYDAFRTQAACLAHALAERGVAPGVRVGVAMANGAPWLLGAYATWLLGGVLVPLDARLEGSALRDLLDHAQPHLLLSDPPTLRRLGAAACSSALIEDLLDQAPATIPHPPHTPRAREDLAAIVYSSGTSARAKACRLTHGNYLSQMQALANLFEFAEDDVYLSILPTNHAIDLMCGFLVPLLCGAQVVHLRALRPEWVTQALRDHRVTHLAAVPALLTALERTLRDRLAEVAGRGELAARGLDALRRLNVWATRDRPRPWVSRTLLRPLHRELGGRLKAIFAGGAPVPHETARFLHELGLPVAIGYGLSEACAVVTVNDLAPFRPDTVGAPLAGTELRLLGRDQHGVGEVLIRGPQVFTGYEGDDELTAQTLDADGWLHTGDLGALDATGHLQLVGRRKDMVVTAGGKNVYPQEVEGLFDGLPGVAERAVLAAPTVWGARPGEDERLLLILRLAADASAPLDEVRARDRRQPAYQRLGGLLVTADPFPRTTSLKVRRAELARALGERHTPAEVVSL